MEGRSKPPVLPTGSATTGSVPGSAPGTPIIRIPGLHDRYSPTPVSLLKAHILHKYPMKYSPTPISLPKAPRRQTSRPTSRASSRPSSRAQSPQTPGGRTRSRDRKTPRKSEYPAPKRERPRVSKGASQTSVHSRMVQAKKESEMRLVRALDPLPEVYEPDLWCRPVYDPKLERALDKAVAYHQRKDNELMLATLDFVESAGLSIYSRAATPFCCDHPPAYWATLRGMPYPPYGIPKK
ncbi:hypothetical protein KIPB_000590 [Kipferlia bialata]|uniref:Uncharacterized protein n=1 Tax=Kipferlia bialata TaxID=797122 RepID=A0A9K3CPB7_9EUKA|nr:hypothetical protein KIPB_000590 [Kipferlia bialata]|eukprot:g590.t1